MNKSSLLDPRLKIISTFIQRIDDYLVNEIVSTFSPPPIDSEEPELDDR